MNSYGFKCLQVDSDPSDTENLLQYHEKKQVLFCSRIILSLTVHFFFFNVFLLQMELWEI